MRFRVIFFVMLVVLPVSDAQYALTKTPARGVNEPCWPSSHTATHISLSFLHEHGEYNNSASPLIRFDRDALKNAEPVDFKRLSTDHNWLHHLFSRHSLIERQLKTLKRKHDCRYFNLSINGLPLRNLIDGNDENELYLLQLKQCESFV